MTYGLLYLMRRSQECEFRQDHDLPKFDLAGMAGASAGNINAALGSVTWCTEALAKEMPDGVFGEAPSESLLWDIWTSVGIEQLFPEYRPISTQPEFAFTRAYFDAVLKDTLIAAMKRSAVSGTCHVPFGVSMTRADSADAVPIAEGLSVETIRYVSLTLLQAWPTTPGRSHRLAFRPLGFSDSVDVKQFGARALPNFDPDEENLENDVRMVFDVSKGSSAFPLAFAPVKLTFRSAPRSSTDEGYFLDGGVFDNRPLDVAYQLGRHRPDFDPDDHDRTVLLEKIAGAGPDAEDGTQAQAVGAGAEAVDGGGGSQPEITCSSVSLNPLTVYVTAQNRRTSGEGATAEGLFEIGMPTGEQKGEKTQPRLSLSLYEPFLSNAIGTARQYELEVLSRNQTVEDRCRLQTTTRYHPIIGTVAASFGGFFGRIYREYDFYVGLYDAAAFVARLAKEHARRNGSDEQNESDELTVEDRHGKLIDAFPVRKDALADPETLLEWLYAEEWHGTPGTCGTSEEAAREEGASDNYLTAVAYAACEWETNRPENPSVTSDLESLAASLTKYWSLDDLEDRKDACERRRSEKPKDERYQVDCLVDPITVDLIRRPTETLYELLEATTAQLRTNELLVDSTETSPKKNRVAERIVETGYFVQRTWTMPRRAGLLWGLSSMPSARLRGQPREHVFGLREPASTALWRLVGPHEVTWNPVRGGGFGYVVRYRPPAFYSKTGVGLVGAASFVDYADTSGRLVLGSGVEWVPRRIGVDARLVPHAVQVRVTAVPHTEGVQAWGGEVIGSTGLEVSAYVLFGKIRIAAHQPTLFRGEPWRGSRTWSFTVGLADVRGLVYWARHIF